MSEPPAIEVSVRLVGDGFGVEDWLARSGLRRGEGADLPLLLLVAPGATRNDMLAAEFASRGRDRIIVMPGRIGAAESLRRRLGIVTVDSEKGSSDDEVSAILLRWSRRGAENAADRLRLDELRGEGPGRVYLPANIGTKRRKKGNIAARLRKLLKRLPRTKGSIRRAQLELIRSSKLFDEAFYLSANPDIRDAGIDPAKHYLEQGWKEGRNPGPKFDNESYLKTHRDVAEAGVNPLVHYLEDGRFEGRAVRGARRESKQAAKAREGQQPWESIEPADVYSPTSGKSVTDSVPPPAFDQVSSLPQVREWLDHLRALSGYAAGVSAPIGSLRSSPVDLWFEHRARLAIRFDGSASGTVHVFQCDPANDGRVQGVGAGRADVGIVTVDLASRFDSLALVEVDDDGRFRGAAILHFPSLARGGLHYPEAALRMDLGESSPLAVDAIFARLAQPGQPRRDIGIAFGNHVVTGAEAWLQPDFADWMARRFGAKLASGVGADLRLGGDDIPTIGVLAHLSRGAADGDVETVRLLVAEEDESQPALLVANPIALARDGNWPLLEGGGFEGPLAIRRARRSLAGALRLFAGTANDCAGHRPVHWIVDVSGDPRRARDTFESLARLDGSEQFTIILSGLPQREITPSLAPFAGRIEALDGPGSLPHDGLVGWIGQGVVFHDCRAAARLAQALLDERVTSASCPLLAVERHGKDHDLVPRDLGHVAGVSVDETDLAAIAHGSTLALAKPPEALWLARGKDVRDWLSRTGEATAMHLLLGDISALQEGANGETVVVPPEAAPDRCTRVERLWG